MRSKTERRDYTQHTIRLPVEEVVVLGKVGDDAQMIRHPGGSHVVWVQQCRDAQLRLCSLKSLHTERDKHRVHLILFFTVFCVSNGK